MKQGRTLTDLAKELERQVQSKKDYLAPTGLLQAEAASDGLVIHMDGQGDFRARPLAQQQIATWAGIPQKYYDRMAQEVPELLAENLNTWFRKKNDGRLVRTLDHDMRAFLSDRYRTIDNWDIAEASLPVLERMNVNLVSCEVTEHRLYLKAVTEKLSFDVKPGDTVQAGIVISNSEVGLGAVRVEPLLYRLVCLNGAIVADRALRRFHIGKQAEDLENAYQVFKDETRKADDRAFFLKFRDVVEAAFDELAFQEIAAATILADSRLIEKEPDKVVELVQKKYQLTEEDKGGVLRNLITGGSLSQWGLANAVTALANHQSDYEKATALERAGGDLMMLDDKQWLEVAA